MAAAASPWRHRRPPGKPGLAAGAPSLGFIVLAVGVLVLLAILAGTTNLQLGASISSQAGTAGPAPPLRPVGGSTGSADGSSSVAEEGGADGRGKAASDGSSSSSSTGSTARSDGGKEGSRETGAAPAGDQAAGSNPEKNGNRAADSSSSSSTTSDSSKPKSGKSGKASPTRTGAGPAAGTSFKPGVPGNRSSTEATCSEALGIKKVALLFLTTRRLAHEKLWRLWMWDAANLVPQQAVQGLQQAVCGGAPAEADARWRAVRAACAPRAPEVARTPGGQPELPPQLLFSIYVHAPPDYKGLEFQPLFQRRVLPQRLRTWWGSAAITDAERLLLAAALRDPANDKFVLVSDHDIPLYDPLTTYQQLAHEPRSRVRACPSSRLSIDRWKDGMATTRLKKHHWRKSNQFFSLTRAHAEAVMQDSEVYRAFKERCGGNYGGQWKECVPDEHYIPTLLAVLGLENETYCDGWGVAYTDWSAGGMHPKSFKPKDVTPWLMKKMRWWCVNGKEAAEDAERMFVPVNRLLAGGDAQQACALLRDVNAGAGGGSSNSSNSSSGYAHPLAGSCPLTARKFPPYTSLRVRQLFLSSCPPGTGQIASKAALTFGLRRDPDLALFRGQACTTGVQKVSLAKTSGSGRRLLCALWSTSAPWLPAAGNDFAPSRLYDRLDALCDDTG